MPFSIKVKLKPSDVPHQDLDSQLFHLLTVVLSCNWVRLQLLGQVCQAPSCSWLYHLLQIRNPLHCTKKRMHISC